MSQINNVTLVAAVLAACLAMVSGQKVDPSGCLESSRSAIDQYNTGVAQVIATTLSKLSKHGQETANVDGFSSQAGDIMKSLAALAKTENFTDVTKLTSAGQAAAQAYLKLGTQIFKTEPITKAIPIYTEFASSLVPLNGNLAASIIAACGPLGSSN